MRCKLTSDRELKKIDPQVFLYGDIVLDTRDPLPIQIMELYRYSSEHDQITLSFQQNATSRKLGEYKSRFKDLDFVDPNEEVYFCFRYLLSAKDKGEIFAFVDLGSFRNDINGLVLPTDRKYHSHDVHRHLRHQFGLIAERLGNSLDAEIMLEMPSFYDPSSEGGVSFPKIEGLASKENLSMLVDESLRNAGIDFIACLTSHKEYMKEKYQKELI